MNKIYSSEEYIFGVFFSFNLSVVNYSLGCKEAYFLVIFFPSEADGPRKCIVRLYVYSLGHHFWNKTLGLWLPLAFLRQKTSGYFSGKICKWNLVPVTKQKNR